MSLVFTSHQMFIEGEDAYHSRADLSTSGVKTFLGSKEQFRDDHVIGVSVKEESDSMRLGSAVHEEVLSASVFAGYEIIPKEVLSKSGSKAGGAWEAYKAANAGKVLLKEAEAHCVDMARFAIAENPLAASLVDINVPGARSELSIVCDVLCGETGEKLTTYRSRFDYIVPGVQLSDIKTIHDISAQQIRYRSQDHFWGVQAAAYKAVADSLFGGDHAFDFVVVKNKPAFVSKVYSPMKSTLDEGLAMLEGAIREIAIRRASGNWHDDDFGTRFFF